MREELARCGEFCYMRSEWFDCTEPSKATSLQGKQGVQKKKVRGGSMCLNLSNYIVPRVPCTPCLPCKAVVKEGSVQSNHPELV